MPITYVRIRGKMYSIKQINTVNRWSSLGMSAERIARELNLTEQEVVDILNRGRE